MLLKKRNFSNDCIQLLKQEFSNIRSQNCKGKTLISFVPEIVGKNVFEAGMIIYDIIMKGIVF